MKFQDPYEKPTRMTHGKSSAGIFVVRVISLQIPWSSPQVFQKAYMFFICSWWLHEETNHPFLFGYCTKKESSTNGKLVLWGLVIWIPGILLRIVTWVFIPRTPRYHQFTN